MCENKNYSSKSKYVIIGNSAAGIGAVEGIRQIDKEGEITVVSDEPYHTYSRPLISYLLLGKTDETKMKYRPDNFYEKNDVILMTSTTALSINPGGKKVELNDGEVFYDKLLVATGSSAFVPKFGGLDTVKNAHTFMSLFDAKKLDKALNAESRVLIIGAGLIGLKCAEGILHKVKKVAVTDLAPRILSSILDIDGAKLVQAHLEEKGIEFLLSHNIKEFKGNTAVFENGNVCEFDVLVTAVGVRANTGLLKGIADVERGIVINGRSETSCKDIYAAGDCTQSRDVSSGESKIMALLPNAYMQGETAGINMAGGEKSFDKAIPMNAIGLFGLHIITAGNYGGSVYSEMEELHCKKLFYGGNRLNGYVLIDSKSAENPAFEKAGIYTSLIRERTPLDSLDFDLICKKPGLMAFTAEDRNSKLGGVQLEA